MSAATESAATETPEAKKKKKAEEADRAMETTEEAREKQRHEGFISQLFLGKSDLNLVYPFPEESGIENLASEKWFEEFIALLRDKVDSNEIDKSGEIPDEVIEDLKKLVAFGIKIPQEYGGLGFSQSLYRKLAVFLGSWDGSISALMSAHNSLGAILPLLKYGTDEQKNRFLPRLAKGAIAAFALTENSVGSDPSRMKTYAQRVYNDSGDVIGYKLCGEKLYTTNAVKAKGKSLAEIIVVTACVLDDPSELKDDKKPKKGLFLIETNNEKFEVVERCHFMCLRYLRKSAGSRLKKGRKL